MRNRKMMGSPSSKRLKLSVLILSLVFLFTWGVLTMLVLVDKLPGYFTIKQIEGLSQSVAVLFI